MTATLNGVQYKMDQNEISGVYIPTIPPSLLADVIPNDIKPSVAKTEQVDG